MIDEHWGPVYQKALPAAYQPSPEQHGSEAAKAPLWIPLVAVITRNHRTFFSGLRVGEDIDLVPNLLSNGENMHNSPFVRLQVLSYYDRHKFSDASKLKSDYLLLFSSEDASVAAGSLLHALQRLVTCRLLDSSGVYIATSKHGYDDLGRLDLTEYGIAWIREIAGFYEAIVYMKDDFWFSGSIPTEIRSCIDCRTRPQRFDALTGFVSHLWDLEKEFLRVLSIEKKRHYVMHFARSAHQPMFSRWFLEELLRFGNEREREQKTSLKRLEALLSEVRIHEAGLAADLGSLTVGATAP